MPNYVEIGQALDRMARDFSGTDCASALTEQATGLLASTGKIGHPSEPIGMTLQRIQERSGSNDLILVGKPEGPRIDGEAPTVFYERDRFISLYPKARIARVVTPTPSQWRLQSQVFDHEGQPLDGYGYLQYFSPDKHEFANLATKNGGFSQNLYVSGATRYISLGGIVPKANFSFKPDESLIDQIRSTRPVAFDRSGLEANLGQNVCAPGTKGRLLGFDHESGEALISGGEVRHLAPKYVDGLQGYHPVELVQSDNAVGVGYRNSVGQLFWGKPTANGGYNLYATPGAMAFPPSEVGCLRGVRSTSLADQLGVPSDTGLRAQGGYNTAVGSGIEIATPSARDGVRGVCGH